MNYPEVDILLSTEEVEKRVRELGAQISSDYPGEKVIAVGILKGAFIFMADLVRNIDLPVEIEFMAVTSYGKAAASSGEVRILKDLDCSIEGQNVIVIEDIIDTGLTLKYIKEILLKREPKSLKLCCMLDKPSRREAAIDVDYIGYSIPDHFVVGYGLDFSGRYRSLPYVGILNPSAYQNTGE